MVVAHVGRLFNAFKQVSPSKQMKWQTLVCLLLTILAAAVFVLLLFMGGHHLVAAFDINPADALHGNIGPRLGSLSRNDILYSV